MKNKKFSRIVVSLSMLVTAAVPVLATSSEPVSDEVIQAQREALASATDGAGFGPQSPRDIDSQEGTNERTFGISPYFTRMNLCDIHFHENAEHRGGEFTTFAGNGDGAGNGTGFKFDGELTPEELSDYGETVGAGEHGDLVPGDTIEIHFVHSTAQVGPGPTLATCLSDQIGNPQLRVETVVGVLVNDPAAADFTKMAEIVQREGFYQAGSIPPTLGKPVRYAGSTTGPGYNEKGSPFQVTWSVRPKVLKIDISSIDAWLKDNPFEERHAHGVRNLVQAPQLLSQMK